SWPPVTEKPGNASLSLFPALLLHCEPAMAFGSSAANTESASARYYAGTSGGGEVFLPGMRRQPMADSTNVETSLTLLRALQDAPPREEAWASFSARFQPVLEQWCRRWGLSGVDAEAAIADLLVKLVDKGLLRHFDPARPFRAWLQAILHNAVRDQQR